MRLPLLLTLGSLTVLSLVVGCSDTGVDMGAASGAGGADGSVGGSAGAAGGSAIIVVEGGSSGSGGIPANCSPRGPGDQDKDGWTFEQGDCNDCDPNINPGAIDVVTYKKDKDGKPTDEPADTQVDEDCSGTPATAADTLSCDDGLVLSTTTDAFDAARALGLCNVKVEENPADPKQRRWGVLEAGFNAISGGFLKNPLQPGVQVGIVPGFGTDTTPREGARALVMSSAEARAPGQEGYNAAHCALNTGLPSGSTSPAPGFPKQSHCEGGEGEPDDPLGGDPYNAVALDLKIRAPTNARSLKFNFRFFSCEYPEYTCRKFNDVFAVIMTPSTLTQGPMYDPATNSANIAFDNNQNVIGVNNADFFTACEPKAGSGYAGCTAGSSVKLIGSGFEDHGASAWLATQASVPAPDGAQATIFYLRLAIWNAGDNQLNSTAVIDNFQWSVEESSSTPTTVIDPPPIH